MKLPWSQRVGLDSSSSKLTIGIWRTIDRERQEIIRARGEDLLLDGGMVEV